MGQPINIVPDTCWETDASLVVSVPITKALQKLNSSSITSGEKPNSITITCSSDKTGKPIANSVLGHNSSLFEKDAFRSSDEDTELHGDPFVDDEVAENPVLIISSPESQSVGNSCKRKSPGPQSGENNSSRDGTYSNSNDNSSTRKVRKVELHSTGSNSSSQVSCSRKHRKEISTVGSSSKFIEIHPDDVKSTRKGKFSVLESDESDCDTKCDVREVIQVSRNVLVGCEFNKRIQRNLNELSEDNNDNDIESDQERNDKNDSDVLVIDLSSTSDQESVESDLDIKKQPSFDVKASENIDGTDNAFEGMGLHLIEKICPSLETNKTIIKDDDKGGDSERLGSHLIEKIHPSLSPKSSGDKDDTNSECGSIGAHLIEEMNPCEGSNTKANDGDSESIGLHLIEEIQPSLQTKVQGNKDDVADNYENIGSHLIEKVPPSLQPKLPANQGDKDNDCASTSQLHSDMLTYSKQHKDLPNTIPKQKDIEEILIRDTHNASSSSKETGVQCQLIGEPLSQLKKAVISDDI